MLRFLQNFHEFNPNAVGHNRLLILYWTLFSVILYSTYEISEHSIWFNNLSTWLILFNKQPIP